jgi:hypothetical protein
MDNYTNLLSGTLIILGAAIMLLNIVRSRKTITVFDSVHLSRNKHLRLLGRLHRGLMVFF